ncbi:translocator protein 2 isoform X1 [Serinus canaria]|uniref:translocator protein 2 isoform X1 n=1 Tax=Serinus canaria TaxID=9135 RepID=UPI0021CC509E|nr:translocator protein 2 isoform X1 [Serinus canaria]XP_050841197.1 translocator protein 2 isoform X1 [Serinus canaria]
MWAYTVGFTVLPHVGGFLGWFLNRKEIPEWYEKLKKPSWCPSRRVFPVAWTMLYTGMGYASYLVWNDLGGCSSKAILPLGLYGAQLVLNWAWPPLFFGAHNLNMFVLQLFICQQGWVLLCCWLEIGLCLLFGSIPPLPLPAVSSPRRKFLSPTSTCHSSAGLKSSQQCL